MIKEITVRTVLRRDMFGSIQAVNRLNRENGIETFPD